MVEEETNKLQFEKSEIINQKKQFIFEVEQTTDYVLVDEVFTYYIYIKNISGVCIEDFTIRIGNPTEVYIEEIDKEHIGINLENNAVKLYQIKASCMDIGKHTVHFIGYGKGSELVHRALTINCSRTYDSKKLVHRINIYDFTPYEEKYSMEASNFSDSVTELFKRQKLPYKAGEEPFKYLKPEDVENIESQSYLDQYKKLKNTNEHSYQYISRESFIEDSVESYTGEGLNEIFDKINKESEYFRGKLLKTGNNELLNDFTQYNPDGFMNRMGLLSSEIYHLLGVIPTYSYMSDILFRWAPKKNDLLNLYPKKVAMHWDRNIWSGRGWIVHRVVTDEYEKTDEFKEAFEKGLIEYDKVVKYFEHKKDAQRFVDKQLEYDTLLRNNIGESIVKFNYVLKENLYDNGVFFVNIPIDKIPSNFFLIDSERLSAVINRVKPYGTKPIINYVIERTFNVDCEQQLYMNYHKNFFFEPSDMTISYLISKNKIISRSITCEGETIKFNSLEPVENMLYSDNFIYEPEHSFEVDYSRVGYNFDTDMTFEEEITGTSTEVKNRLHTIKDLRDLLYQNNYNSLAFYYKMKYESLIIPEDTNPIDIGSKNNYLTLQKGDKEIIFDSLKLSGLHINDFDNKGYDFYFILKDSMDKRYKFSLKYDEDMKMGCVTYTYINKNNESFVRKKGYQNIKSIGFVYQKVNTKTLVIFVVQDNENKYHYFHHVLASQIVSFDANKTSESETKSLLKQNVLYSFDTKNQNICFETPFVYESKSYKPSIIKGGNNWINLYKLNDNDNSYSYIKNLESDYILPDDIKFFYDNIDIPETSNIKKIRVKLVKNNSEESSIYLSESFNTNYKIEEANGYNLQLTPQKIEAYNHLNESNEYYKFKLKSAEEQGQDTYIKTLNDLINENYIFDEDIDFNIKDLHSPDDFIIVEDEYWCEVSDFTDLTYELNNIENINLVIEGYNTSYPTSLVAETLYEYHHSSSVKEEIPSGYFRKKIPLLFPNNYLLGLLRTRFRFKRLTHPVKVFDVKLELTFKKKEASDIIFNKEGEIEIISSNNDIITLENEPFESDKIINGLGLNFSFDELKPGSFYQINSIGLEVIYKDTEINMLLNYDRYNDIYYDLNESKIFGKSSNAYLSGEFYNDVATMSQHNSNIGINNQGIKLRETLYQSFESRADNITSIEIFPNSLRGNPDEVLKLGLYTNSNNTPGKLIKEVLVNGWTKNNEEMKNLTKIKYNFNVDNLKKNTKYWFKLEVLNPRKDSYYMLNGIDETQSGFKLLANENNNYINTFSCLKFNIYSKNLSQSFNNIDVLQTYFNNPYVKIGLHKGQGEICQLQTEKPVKKFYGNDSMGELIEQDNEIKVMSIIVNEKDEEEYDLMTKEA